MGNTKLRSIEIFRDVLLVLINIIHLRYLIIILFQYLERRFNRSVRILGAISFTVNTLLYMGVVLYGPCLALEPLIGLPVWVSILGIGVLCTFYTTLVSSWCTIGRIIPFETAGTIMRFPIKKFHKRNSVRKFPGGR